MIDDINHNDYKLKNIKKKMGRSGKRGQMTLFIIVAIVIVSIILVIALYPRIKVIVSGDDLSPGNYLKSCMLSDVKKNIEILNKQGGEINPTGFYVYQGGKVKFLCYTAEYYQTCVVQQPMLVSHYESELAKTLNQKARFCFDSMKEEYTKRGYSVTGGIRGVNVELSPKSVNVVFDAPLQITKESTQTFSKISANIDSKVYDLLSISQSIVEFETVYGDSEITAYLKYYPDLRIEKITQSDGTKIYKVSDVTSKEEFVFASRSLSWPPGYGGLI